MGTLWPLFSAVRDGDAAVPKLIWDFFFSLSDILVLVIVAAQYYYNFRSMLALDF